MIVKKINSEEVFEVKVKLIQSLVYNDLEKYSQLLNKEIVADEYETKVGIMVVDEAYFNEINFYGDGTPFYNLDETKIPLIHRIYPEIIIEETILKIGEWYLINNKPFIAVEVNKMIAISEIACVVFSSKESFIPNGFIEKCLSDFFKAEKDCIKKIP